MDATRSDYSVKYGFISIPKRSARQESALFVFSLGVDQEATDVHEHQVVYVSKRGFVARMCHHPRRALRATRRAFVICMRVCDGYVHRRLLR